MKKLLTYTHLLFSLSLLLLASTSHGQGTIGFSGQTQPSIIMESQYIRRTAFDSAHKYTVPRSSNITAYTTAKSKLAVSPGYVKDVPSTGISIDDATTLLTEYDRGHVSTTSRRGLGRWLVGIVSDGDFNKTLANATAPTAKTGSLGIDAVWMKPVYYTYTYRADTSRHLPYLVGEQTIRRPLVAFNTLVVLFSGTPALSTNVAAGAGAPKPGIPTTSLTQQRLFGQSLLVPNGYSYGSGISFTTNATWYFGVLRSSSWIKNLGVTGSVTVVQNNWSTRDTTTAINILAPSIGLNYRLIEAHFKVGEQDNYVQVQPFLRYTMRHLFGDIEYHPRLLADAIGTTNRDFHAFDIGLMLTINAVRLTANVPVFYGADKIEGFTHGQPVVGFGLAAAIRLTD